MSALDFFALAAGVGFVWLVGYVVGHADGWVKGFSECSEAHAPKGKGGEK